MIKEEAEDYVRRALLHRTPVATIKARLRARGFSWQDIEETLDYVLYGKRKTKRKLGKEEIRKRRIIGIVIFVIVVLTLLIFLLWWFRPKVTNITLTSDTDVVAGESFHFKVYVTYPKEQMLLRYNIISEEGVALVLGREKIEQKQNEIEFDVEIPIYAKEGSYTLEVTLEFDNTKLKKSKSFDIRSAKEEEESAKTFEPTDCGTDMDCLISASQNC